MKLLMMQFSPALRILLSQHPNTLLSTSFSSILRARDQTFNCNYDFSLILLYSRIWKWAELAIQCCISTSRSKRLFV